METPIFLGPSSLMCKCPRWAFCYPANQSASSIDALYAGGTVICDAKLKRAPACARRARGMGRRPHFGRPGHIPRPGVEGIGITISHLDGAPRTTAGQMLAAPLAPAPKHS